MENIFSEFGTFSSNIWKRSVCEYTFWHTTIKASISKIKAYAFMLQPDFFFTAFDKLFMVFVNVIN